MATINAVEPVNRERIAWAVLGGSVAVVVAIVVARLWPPPQMGTDHKVFDTVDALFTAVTAHDEKRLADCERRLAGYRAAGTLPTSAGDFLDGVIRTARAGGWQSAAERLYDFMKAQRREGAADPPKRPKNASAKRR